MVARRFLKVLLVDLALGALGLCWLAAHVSRAWF
jgi:hypothetical protein